MRASQIKDSTVIEAIMPSNALARYHWTHRFTLGLFCPLGLSCLVVTLDYSAITLDREGGEHWREGWTAGAIVSYSICNI